MESSQEKDPALDKSRSMYTSEIRLRDWLVNKEIVPLILGVQIIILCTVITIIKETSSRSIPNCVGLAKSM